MKPNWSSSSKKISSAFSSSQILNSKLFKIVLFAILTGIITLNMTSLFLSNKDKYLSTDYWERYPSLKQTYYNSVYANKHGSFVPDEILYAFNGGALITGTSPILVNPEIPPTGKYLIGLSILMFRNEHIIILIFGILSLFMMYMIGRKISKSFLVPLIAPMLISFEPFFKNQFIYTPLIDIFQLVFLLCSFYFFNIGLKNNRKAIIWFGIAGLFVGLFISTKFFATGISIIAAFAFVLLFHKKIKKVIFLLLSFLIAICVLLLSYVRVLIIGYPFLKFLGIQKWVFWYNQGHLHNHLSVWPLILFNQWIQANGKILHDPQWRITWPISLLILVIIVLLFFLKKMKLKRSLEVLIAWSIFYLGMLSLSDATTRYFVILLPVLFIIAVWGIEQMTIYFFNKYENRR